VSRIKGHVKIFVDAKKTKGRFLHMWRFIGYDEINYTTTPNGEATLERFMKLSDGSYYVRAHHLLCTGNCRGMLKWGSTNAYIEDDAGNPIYNWKIIDEIFDTYIKFNCKPFVELGFMPLHLADVRGQSSWHWWYAGWNCPPKSYEKWYDLIFNLVKHCVERYGVDEVKTWYWEVWNEPDMPYYWMGTLEEYCKLYDYTAAAVEAALPDAKIGGPATTGPSFGSKSAEWLDKFLNHCINGKNYYDGDRGSRLDFISFHAKGAAYRPVWGKTRSNVEKQTPSIERLISQVKLGLEIIDKYPAVRETKCILTECDPDGWAAGGVWDNPNLEFRNTEYYPTYVAAAFKRLMDLADEYGRELYALTWAFTFDGERTFEGTRAFTTNGFDKPILNLFRLYSRLGNIKLASSLSKTILTSDSHKENDALYIDVIATLSDRREIGIMIFSHHDDWDMKGEYEIEMEVINIPFIGQSFTMTHYRIDKNHSNAYTEWIRQGRPKYSTAFQAEKIISRQELELYEPRKEILLKDGKFKKKFTLPLHGVSLIMLSEKQEKGNN